MAENVVWNASALVVKGDRHNVTRNTVFDGSDIAASYAAHDRPRYQDHTSALNNLTIPSVHLGAGTKQYDPRADQLTVFSRNIFDSVVVAGKKCPNATCRLPGTYTGNLIGGPTPQGGGTSFDIRAELRDPFHLDFRACPGSNADKSDAGAYPTWTADDVSYWIPGRRDGKGRASAPVPPTGSIGVHVNTELMFMPSGSIHAVGHSVYFGEKKAGAGAELPLPHLVDLTGAANIARPVLAGATLNPGTTYAWRVDAHDAMGGTKQGEVWTLRTDPQGAMSCKIAPHPPPHPAPPGPQTCAAAEQSQCPGEAGKGANKGDPCYNCVVKESKPLEDAGCWTKGATGARHAFIETFCG